MRVPWILGYMCTSSTYSWLPRRSVTGSFPSGNILAPFTALGITSEGMRELVCSLRWTSISFPDAEISAPESGRTLMSREPFEEVMVTEISRAGSEDAMW